MTIAHHLPPQPVAPILNLNGSDGARLIDDNRAVVQLLYAAEQALRQCTPHGRDYIGYPEAYEQARHEHKLRLLDLERIMLELDLVALAIQRQQRS
jgi:hypothetical protein